MLGIAALVSIVPLATWAATGRLRAAWEALRGYCLVMFIVVGLPMIAGALVGLLANIITP